jgi:hypothetical protein
MNYWMERGWLTNEKNKFELKTAGNVNVQDEIWDEVKWIIGEAKIDGVDCLAKTPPT